MAAQPEKTLTQTEFALRLLAFPVPDSETDIAVAVSGGGDSMALAWLLSRWAKKNGKTLHALTVDHGLRPEAAAEAKQVGGWMEALGIIHKTLRWKGAKPVSRIQEAARDARYKLMAGYCREHGIRSLFLAHHANDQAETILFRLAKGSGLDGLTGIAATQEYSPDLTLCRPLLEVTHQQLLKTCRAAKIDWVEDKSNVSDRYARVRLRQSMSVLEGEGLSLKRILSLGKRLDRARKALDQVTDSAWESSALNSNSKQIVFNYKSLLGYPEEVVLRCIMRAIQTFRVGRAYPPSLENLETLVSALVSSRGQFKAATLGGCLIRLQKKAGLVTVQRETTK